MGLRGYFTTDTLIDRVESHQPDVHHIGYLRDMTLRLCPPKTKGKQKQIKPKRKEKITNKKGKKEGIINLFYY